jgi:hypothetical protein
MLQQLLLLLLLAVLLQISVVAAAQLPQLCCSLMLCTNNPAYKLLPKAVVLLALLQDSPGQGSKLDACSHVETLLSHLLQQQLKDYKQLCGSRGMHK